MRNVLLGLLLVCFSGVYSQHAKVNIALKQALKKEVNQDKLFPLFVLGNASKIRSEVLKLKGEVVRSVQSVVQVKLPVGVIEEFSKNEFVESIPYSFAKGEVLADTMLIHNNVTPVHSGISPLLQSYTGKNVVFGVIDTGQDIVHPDFKDTLGNTRIYRIWDQVTGEYWDSTAINNGSCTHVDHATYTGHGTQVAGIGAGNGLALNKFDGVAGESTIVAVASDFSSPNWLLTVVDAVDYIYSVADSLNMPCVINISAGSYFGSHDGTDPAALLIDSIVNHKPGRALVCAAGNAGSFNWHVEQTVTSDTSFSWLKYNPSSGFGFGSVYYEVWSDTADFNNVDYAFGANLPSGTFEEKGRTPFFNIQSRLGNYTDTIWDGATVLAIVETYGELQDDKYLLEVMLNEPDSNTYNFSFLSTGSGKFDFWSTTKLATSDIVETGLPTAAQYPPIVHYTLPDSFKTTVSSFTCLPSVLTVANFVNRATYIDMDTQLVVLTSVPGELASSSSKGPDRRGNIKPDIGATGNSVLAANPATVIALNAAAGPGNRAKIALGSMHRRNGGTSMASPVVAGVAALYLEKCPTATMAEIKAAIQGTAKQDIQTGVVPNFGFGHGKVDAFAALNNSNFAVTLGSDQNVCDGDSVQITSPSYSSYDWSTGAVSQSIYVDTTESLYVTVTNASGCKSISDTVDVIWRPLPLKPTVVLMGNDSLVHATNLDVQWYYNSGILSGETDTLHIAQNSGDYFVEVTDSFGCKNISDTINFIALGIDNVENDLFSIYPNPTSGNLTIQFNDQSIESVSMVNLLGEEVLKNKIRKLNKVTLDISQFSDGVYYIRLNSKDNKYIRKLLLLR